MNSPGPSDVKRGISVLWESLQCPICLDLMTAPVSTKCDHQFCKYCMTKLLENTKHKAKCPVCKAIVTKRSLQESPGFQRLVAGLQEMIQAYEYDTGTNYLTGMPRPRSPKVTDAEAVLHPRATSSGDTADSEHENTEILDSDEVPKSHSSTVEAQNGFARLMGLEDSSPLMTENGLDSGLGGAPPGSDRKMQSPADDLEAMDAETSQVVEKTTRRKTRSSERASRQEASPPLGPDELEPLVKSSSKKQKKDVDKDKIADHKRKESLEKVAEWLMKVPSEESLESEKPNQDEDGDESDSSASTIDIRQYTSDVKRKNEERAKTLEDQVFGAVYKREPRKSRTSSPPLDVFVQSPEAKDSEPGAEQQHVIEDVMDGSSDIFKEAEQMSENAADDLSERGKTNGESENQLPADEIEPQRTLRRRMTRNSLQEVDSDLLTKATTESTEQPKTDKRRGKNTKGKSGKVAKPLVLVAVEDGERSPKPKAKLEDVQLHIENYPSSEDQEPPARSSRRSRRLKVFADVVQQGNKKGKAKISTLEKDTQQPQDINTTSPMNGNIIKAAERNGCVFNDDLGGIEPVGSPLGQSYVKPAEDAKDGVSETETGALPQANAASDTTVVPDSTSPAVVDATLESDNPENCIPNSNQLESQGAKSAVPENDSEMDTEQLLMSFKVAKRKSFHLGGPALKRRREDQGDVQSPKAEKSQRVCSSAESANGKVYEATVQDEAVRDNESLPCSDLISPSISPKRTRKRAAAGLDQALVGASVPGGSSAGQDRDSLSSVLPPNKPSRRELDSPCLSVVPQVVDSGLCFVAVEKGEKEERSTEINGVPKRSADTVERVVNTEGSLTPDGLLAAPDGPVLEPCTGDLSVRSSVRGPTGKRATTPGLRSSPGSSNSSKGEDGEGASCLAACPSPDCDVSSQASVDLFGTPEECDVAVNEAGVSIESSQFSNEVLVTQQKMEMQEELVRLEKLICLVSEVLQEKEGSPAKTNQSGTTTGADTLRPDQDVAPEGKGAPEAEKDPTRGAPEGTGGSAAQTAPPSEAVSASKLQTSHPAVDQRRDSPSEDKENNTPPPRGGGKARMVLVTSGLGSNEQSMVKKFAKKLGALLVSKVTPEVTHVIMQTDEQLVCERTLKYFLGIAGRKWVLSFQWVSESFKQKKLLDESGFEVRGDAVNGPDHQGPRRARTTPDNHLLMKGYRICLQGLFSGMSTDEMELMVELCGATVVKDPLLLDSKQKSRQLVIVNPGSESSSSTYSSLSRKAAVVTRGWLLDTVATYTLQDFNKYTV